MLPWWKAAWCVAISRFWRCGATRRINLLELTPNLAGLMRGPGGIVAVRSFVGSSRVQGILFRSSSDIPDSSQIPTPGGKSRSALSRTNAVACHGHDAGERYQRKDLPYVRLIMGVV
jgi:hypothetical protein